MPIYAIVRIVMAEIPLQQLLAREGKSLYRVAKNTNIRLRRLMQYCDNSAKVLSLDHVEPLCRELNCAPGDLLVLTNGKGNGNGTKKKKRSKRV